jgi:hypothetical protein
LNERKNLIFRFLFSTLYTLCLWKWTLEDWNRERECKFKKIDSYSWVGSGASFMRWLIVTANGMVGAWTLVLWRCLGRLILMANYRNYMATGSRRSVIICIKSYNGWTNFYSNLHTPLGHINALANKWISQFVKARVGDTCQQLAWILEKTQQQKSDTIFCHFRILTNNGKRAASTRQCRYIKNNNILIINHINLNYALWCITNIIHTPLGIKCGR